MSAPPSGRFTVFDFIVLGASFAISVFIGIYFALVQRKKENTAKYFVGNRDMGVIPISLSYIATTISAVTFLGLPAEVYSFGPDYVILIPMRVVAIFIVTRSFVPVFYQLQLTSIFEYLEIRFDKSVKIAGMVIFYVFTIFYMGFVVYAPALALSLVTGMSVVSSILTVILVCIFYTTIGGMKAVIWTDVVQSFLMFTGLLAIIVAALKEVGGFHEMSRLVEEGDRGVSFIFEADITIRYSVYASICGGFFNTLALHSTGQHIIQRYLSCRTVTQAKVVVWLGFMLACAIVSLAVMSGLAIYAYYSGCDPRLTGRIERFDQIVPLIIGDLFHVYPGLPGLIVSGAFSASLSTISSSLNAMAAVFEAAVLRIVFKGATEKKLTVLSKISSFGFGLVCMTVALLASKLSGVLEETIALISIITTPLSAVFCLGIFTTRCNSKGAHFALLTGIILGLWIKIGSEVHPSPGKIPILSTENCPSEYINMTSEGPYMYSSTNNPFYSVVLNQTIDDQENDNNNSHIITFYNMSVYLYSIFTFIVPMVVGYLVSFITKEPPSPDPRLYVPIFDVFYCCSKGRHPPLGRQALKATYEEVDKKDVVDENDNLSDWHVTSL